MKGVVLVDDDRSGHNAKKAFEEVFADAVPVEFTHATPAGTASGKSIGDLFAREDYVDLLNVAYASIGGYQAIVVGELDATKPICEAVQAVFDARGLGGLNKLLPACELQARLHAGGTPPSAESTGHFTELFSRLNTALAGPSRAEV